MDLDVAGEICLREDYLFGDNIDSNDQCFFAESSNSTTTGDSSLVIMDICFPSDICLSHHSDFIEIGFYYYPLYLGCGLTENIDEDKSSVALTEEKDDEYNIYDVVKQHAENVEFAKTLDILAKGAGFIYYGAVLYTCPIPTVAYLALKILKDNNLLYQYCDPSKNEIAFGYTICDLTEDALHSYSIYSFGGVVSKLVLSVVDWKSVVLDVTAETLMKTLLLNSGKNLESGDLPRAIDYLPGFSQVVSSEVAKVVISSAASQSIPKPLQVVAQQLIGQGTKYAVQYYAFEEGETGSALKPFRNAISATVCKTLLPDFKKNSIQSHGYTQCLKGMRTGIEQISSISLTYIYYSRQDESTDIIVSKKEEEEIRNYKFIS